MLRHTHTHTHTRTPSRFPRFLSIVPLLLTLVTLAAVAPRGTAQVTWFAAALDGSQVLPPNAAPGTGWAIVRLAQPANTVRILVHHDGLTGIPAAAHLHVGVPGAAGPIALPLAIASPTTLTANAALAPADVAALLAGATYLDVHTAAFAAGEIRGQVLPATSTRFTGVLTGAQQVPPVVTPDGGTIVAFLHQPENRLVYAVETTLTGPTQAQLRNAPAGANGPLLANLIGGNGTFCGVTDALTTAQVNALLANAIYVTVATPGFPAGELRAQLGKSDGDDFVAHLSAAQEVPPNASPALGNASLTVSPLGVVRVRGVFGGLVGAPTAAHVHVGPVGTNGPIVAGLTLTAGGGFEATFTASTAGLADLRAGDWYVNVHTAAFGNGEIRGQLRGAELPATFGAGCAGSPGIAPQAGATGVPTLGAGFDTDLYGALPGTLAVLFFGVTRDGTPALPLPVELPVLGPPAPGCFVLTAPASTTAAVTNAAGCASLRTLLPFAPGLRGAEFYAQWLVFDALANPAGLVTSNGVSLTIR